MYHDEGAARRHMVGNEVVGFAMQTMVGRDVVVMWPGVEHIQGGFRLGQ